MTLPVRKAVGMVRMVRKSRALGWIQHRHWEATFRVWLMPIREHVATPTLGILPVFYLVSTV